jgi:hypothetical protein
VIIEISRVVLVVFRINGSVQIVNPIIDEMVSEFNFAQILNNSMTLGLYHFTLSKNS